MMLQLEEFDSLSPLALAARQLVASRPDKQDAAVQVFSLLLAATATQDDLLLYLLLKATVQYGLSLLQWLAYARCSAALQQMLQAPAISGKVHEVLRFSGWNGLNALTAIRRTGHAGTLGLDTLTTLDVVR